MGRMPFRPVHLGDSMNGRRTADRDRGSATVWAVGAIAAELVVAVAVMVIGSATVLRHRTTAAADLAAVAAAAHAPGGERFSCSRAERVAQRMSTTLRRCRLEGWDAVVEVSAAVSGPFAGTTVAHARAGPAER